MQSRMTENRSGIFWGAVMVIVGVIVLASQYFEMGWLWSRVAMYFLPMLGLGFLSWGIIKRNPGFMIPGGILTGLGTGILLTSMGVLGGANTGGVFMLSFAMGFVLVTIATAIFTEETQWWGLIPGGIMALVGLTVMYGGVFERVLILIGQLWPLGLIVGGILIIYRVSRRNHVAQD